MNNLQDIFSCPDFYTMEHRGSKSQFRTSFSVSFSKNQFDVLIHHVYALLANIEIPNASDSSYSVSNQISGYLVDLNYKKTGREA